jgi:hypothetical protein
MKKYNKGYEDSIIRSDPFTPLLTSNPNQDGLSRFVVWIETLIQTKNIIQQMPKPRCIDR